MNISIMIRVSYHSGLIRPQNFIFLFPFLAQPFKRHLTTREWEYGDLLLVVERFGKVDMWRREDMEGERWYVRIQKNHW